MLLRFGVFEFDAETKELRRAGRPLKLEPQAAEMLALLLEKPGTIYTVDDIRQRLWPANTHVVVGAAIGRCLNAIREVLGDDARNPTYIETRKRVGYVFIAPVIPVSNPIGKAPEEIAPLPRVDGSKSASLFGRNWDKVLIAVILTFLGTQTVVAMTSAAYWLAIGFSIVFILFVLAVAGMGPVRSPGLRTAISVPVLAVMAYIGSASTLPYVTAHVVNASTLTPALAYPFATGLKFIPLYVLVFGFWILLSFWDDEGFARNPVLGKTYVLLGIGFLLATVGAVGALSGDYQILEGRLPGYVTIVSGYLIVLACNIGIWLAGFRAFRREKVGDLRQLFLICAVSYFPLSVAAAVVDQQYNEVNHSYLDQRRPVAYRAENPDAVKSIASALPADMKDQIGQDLLALLRDPRFLSALRSQPFYREDFDEPFQVGRHAVMFGYRETEQFRIIRFPEQLAAAIRFEPDFSRR